LTSKQQARILRKVRANVLKRHFNAAGIDYAEWSRYFDSRIPELMTADKQAFEAGVRELLSRLGTSHTLFYHNYPDRILPQHSINATVRAFPAVNSSCWFFLDVFDNGPASMVGIRPGDALHAVNGIECGPPTLPRFDFDQVHTATISKPDGNERRSVLIPVPLSRGTKSRPPFIEPTPMTHRVLENKIGLLAVRYFPGAMGLHCAHMLDSAIADLKDHGCDRLVVDLRGNIGGGLGFARLVSYFSPDQIPIGHSLTPKRARASYDKDDFAHVPMPSTRPELVFTLARYMFRDTSIMLMTQGLGPQPFHGRIIVLINEWTNSAGEMVASFASESRRATVVGTKTPGNVLGAGNIPVGYGYWLRLPMAGWYTATGRPVEGNGVEPDVSVDPDPQSLSVGVDAQLDEGIKILTSRTTRVHT
jgi:C-terminal processing protease CtpA/Prc